MNEQKNNLSAVLPVGDKMRGQQMMITIVDGPAVGTMPVHSGEWSLAYATTDSFNPEPNVADTSNKDDGLGGSSMVVSKAWNLASSHIATMEDNTASTGTNLKSLGLRTLRKWFEAGTELNVLWGYITERTGKDIQAAGGWVIDEGKKGRAKITALTENAPNGDLFTFDITLSGQGMYEDYTHVAPTETAASETSKPASK